MMDIKKKIFRFTLPLLKLIGGLFFDKRYLNGKYFECSLSGWGWVLRSIVWQKIFGLNRHIPWPVSPFIKISDPNNIKFDANDINNFQTFGNYFQNFGGKIYIGKGTYIAPNVGIITVNHNPNNLDEYLEGNDVIIGTKCWIGMNSVILPGVELGDRTIVGAGSIVTKSFPQGNVTMRLFMYPLQIDW
uniref:2,3,4,5-tetrahydropyridine-2,6-dicarboxylate N-acetyltransferase n=1 Tax=Candidatus Methanogaster sp. ANME-2c ERB4 TaxID=2759911 RepID=A0A7G9YF70_9EURY|nr:2,3,4,5-tetrahydropyridine-2,6-dicarboxylate N-acetyltransferase [Methanosarcinales archaeon ANME-2c ERB4]